jgi:hypothetical protein
MPHEARITRDMKTKEETESGGSPQPHPSRYAEQRRWIRCEGHYFDTESDVIVCTNKGTRTIGDCCEVNGWHLCTLLEDDEWVTHWQPMPEAPAAANENEGDGLEQLERRYEEIMSRLPEDRVSGRHND